MGYKFPNVRKGIYQDGHERHDVVQYRQECFLPGLKGLEDRRVRAGLVASNQSESLQIKYPTDLPAGVKSIVLVVHDESTFNGNDGRSKIWIKDDQMPLKKKPRGKGIIVLNSLTPGGRLRAPEAIDTPFIQEDIINDNAPRRRDLHLATCSIGYGGDTWWDGAQLVDQVLKMAIQIFELAFPHCQALFLFDNATSHSAFSKDALRARTMNLRMGGAQPTLRPGINSLSGEIQPMVIPEGIPKGLQIVLQERGLWRPRLHVQCRKPNGQRNKRCLNGASCCARALIAQEPDFKAQNSRLEEEVELIGHLVHFFPKYHCELNFIEYYSGAAKHYACQRCGYTIRALRKIVPQSLNSVKSTVIREYWARTGRMMTAYREYSAYQSVDFKEKVTTTYRSHRRVSNSQTIFSN